MIIIAAVIFEKITLIYVFVSVTLVMRAFYYPIGWLGRSNILIEVSGHVVGLMLYFLVNFIYIVLLKKNEKLKNAEYM